jgi:hypothetical protein
MSVLMVTEAAAGCQARVEELRTLVRVVRGILDFRLQIADLKPMPAGGAFNLQSQI